VASAADPVARADAAMKALQGALLSRLREEMARGGPPAAITVCRDEAQAITARIAKEQGLALGRTSDRLRSSANAPPAWARETVATSAGKRAAEVQQLTFDLGDRVRSANVVARSAGWGEGRPVLVLTAHLDTKTQLLPTAAQLLALFSALVSLVGLWVVALIDSMSAGRVPNGALVVLTAIAVTGLVTVAANVGSPRLSRGVLDNGSGVALILHLASLLPARVGNRLNLLLVATGAEEIGLAGALRFAQRHRGSLDPGRTLCLNFDVLGHGGRVFLTGSRAPFAGVRDRLVARLIGRGFAVGSLPFLLGAGMDHQRLSAAGLWAISLTEGPGQVLWHVHGRDDRHDLVDPERLARIAEALLETVEDIASDAFVPGKSR
jgi:hypothetical protein